MLPRLLILAAGKVVGFPSRIKLWTFNAACRRPRGVQESLLTRILAEQADIPCGSLSGLTVRAQKRFIRFLYCLPPAASTIKDTHAKFYVALRLSLGRPVGMVLAANPSTLAALGRLLNEEKESLLRDLRDGTLTAKLNLPDAARADLRPYLKRYRRRARQLDRIAEKTGELWPRDAWPRDR